MENERKTGGFFGGLNVKHFKYLLFILFALFFIVPLVSERILQVFPGAGKALFLIVFIGTLIAASSIVSRDRRIFMFTTGASVLAVAFNTIYLVWSWDGLLIINHSIISLVLVYVIVSLTRYLFTCEDVTQYTIYASLCSYLLMALLWALLYSIVDMVDPGAFKVPLEIAADGRLASLGSAGDFHALYFSIVTITTLGYGDISPITSEARMLCSGEAFAGQMYLAVTIARLVGIYSSKSVSVVSS